MREWPFAAALALLASGCPHHPSVDPCEGAGTRVLVLAASHALILCEDGRSSPRFHASLGRGGLDKRAEGDARTPIGTYALGEPRASAEFHAFIPVGYPTEAQRAEGRTGGAIGVHGPARRSRRLGFVNGWFDWTRGCIAVTSDARIDAIAQWVRAHPGAVIEIR